MNGMMTSKEPTQTLVRRAREGDRQAFDLLLARYTDRLRSSVTSWARFQLGPNLDADEVLQETFTISLESLGRFEWQGEDSFYLWLCGIAKRVVLKTTREAVRKQQASVETDGMTDEVSPSKALRRDERFERLQDSIEKLKPEYREVIRLARIEGLKVKQIADRMNRSPNAIKHLLARALNELKNQFGDTGTFHLPNRRLKFGGDPHEE